MERAQCLNVFYELQVHHGQYEYGGRDETKHNFNCRTAKIRTFRSSIVDNQSTIEINIEMATLLCIENGQTFYTFRSFEDQTEYGFFRCGAKFTSADTNSLFGKNTEAMD